MIYVVPINKAKGEKMVLETPMNSAQRRKLGDITNSQNQNKLMSHGAKEQQQAILFSSKVNAEKLQKENMRLMKVIVERNEIIALNGSELQKLRIGLQKVQELNLLLAQANTRILAELNTSKDQLKVLQHELSCKKGLLIARKLQVEAQNLPCTRRHTLEDKARENTCGGACKTFQPNGAYQKNASESSTVNSIQFNEKVDDAKEIEEKARLSLRKPPVWLKSQEPEPPESSHESIEATNRRRASLRRQSARFSFQELDVTENLNGVHDDQEIAASAGCSVTEQSIESKPEAVEPHETKEITGKSRVSSRRRSTKIKPQRDTKDIPADPPLHDAIVEESSQMPSSVSMELKRESKNEPRGTEAEEMSKTSAGRPIRQAAIKIKSYKEVSLKEKMRRNF